MEKQITAIDWLVENLYYILKTEHYDIILQAKEMEKEQHSQTWDAALDKYEARAGNYMRAYEDFDDYYEQFKNK